MRAKFYLFLLTTFITYSAAFGQMLVGSDTLVGNEWIQYGRQYYKFSLAEDGVYRITAQALMTSGIDPGTVTGASLRLYSMGRQVPIFVSTDGALSANDFIEFFGHKNRSEMDRYLFLHPDKDMLNPEYSLYTDSSYYYLSLDGEGAPVRVQQISNDLNHPPAAAGYFLYQEQVLFTTTHFDPYIPVDNGGAVSYSSYMHGEGFCKGSEFNASVNISGTDRSASGPDAILHLRMTSSNNGSHSFPVLWNDQLITTLHPFNIQIIDTSFVIPLSALQDNNQLKINSDLPISRMSIASVTLTYPKLLTYSVANQSSLFLSPDPASQYYVLEGYSHGADAPIIYTDDGRQRMISDFDSQNHVHFVWPPVSNETTLQVIDPNGGMHLIPSLEPKKFIDWSGDDTEFIIITHPDLMPAGTASDYVQYRSSAQGGSYKAKAYSILDIYDQFGYGIEKHPQSIRNFVEFAHRHWPSAKMIFIVGRAIEYDQSRQEDGSWESWFYVPTFGKPGSDQLLAATLWDLVPRYPISRLAVTDANTIEVYLNKVKEHDSAANEGDQTIEDKEWIKHVIHISGGKNATEQSDFKQVMASLGEELTATDFGAKIYSFQKETSDFIGESQSQQINKLLHEGSSIINYLGHSSTSTFEFNINDPTQWNNKGHYPIFCGMGCSAGAIHSTLLSLSDRYVQIPDEGAIAFISGSGSQFAPSLITWAHPWYDYFGSLDYGTSLGESILYGLQAVGKLVNPEFSGLNYYRYLLEQQTTQGDPAIKINPLPGPDYLVDRNSVSVSPALLSTRQDSFDLQFSIVNIGRNLRQYVTYSISLRSPDGQVIDLLHASALVDRTDVPITVRLPLQINKKSGVYRLLISLDDENLINELPAPAAENNNRLMDNLGVEGVALVVVDNVMTAAWPPDFAIVNKAPVTLVATGSNAFSKPMNILVEVDSNGLFNSPSLIRQEFPAHSGTLKWTLEKTLVPGQEYFWRVSTDSISPEQGFIWSRHSFTYLPDKSTGWSQSHFHQLTHDPSVQITPDSMNYRFDFGRKVKNYTMVNRFHDVPAGLVPYFFEDGIFNARLAQRFRDKKVHGFVVAIDSVTGNYIMNTVEGLYGSVPDPLPMPGFAYDLTTPESRQNMINLIDHVIPAGYYVFFYTYQHTNFEDYHPETWADDEAQFGKSIFSVIENQYPGSKIRTLQDKGSVPYIVLFQKDRGPIEEQIAADFNDVISISFDGTSFFKSGSYVSVPIGPASHWGSIENQITNFNDTTGSVTVSAWVMSPDLSDTLWISHDITDAQLDISAVDARTYPWMQMKVETVDSATYRPAQIDYWRVLYDGYPEFTINPDAGFQFIADTLTQGEKMSLRATVENVSDFDADSLPVTLNIIGSNSQTEELRTTLKPFGKLSSREVYFERSTGDLLGDYQVVMELNPDHNTPEQVFSNNIGLLSMVVLKDGANPVLDVTFDGAHIKNGDVVAAKPLILLSLHDESPYLRMEDTSLFEMYLQFPSEYELKRIPFTSDWVTFTGASPSGENVARVEMRPDLTEDGVYQLEVQAKDAAGNVSGDNDYFISFRVIHEQTISRIINYPNPFNSTTRFAYSLTGEGSPAFYKIQIISMNGIVVREITQDQLGPLVVGTHVTNYEWDGTDNNGNPLAAGVYLYKMFAKNEKGEDYGHYETYDENLFKNNWGKLVIVR